MITKQGVKLLITEAASIKGSAQVHALVKIFQTAAKQNWITNQMMYKCITLANPSTGAALDAALYLGLEPHSMERLNDGEFSASAIINGEVIEGKGHSWALAVANLFLTSKLESVV